MADLHVLSLGESNHTAGPWRARRLVRQTDDPGTTVAVVRDGWVILSDAEHHGEIAADAQLMAAAPQMLEALEALEKAVNESVSGMRTVGLMQWSDLLARSQSAIAAAQRGRRAVGVRGGRVVIHELSGGNAGVGQSTRRVGGI